MYTCHPIYKTHNLPFSVRKITQILIIYFPGQSKAELLQSYFCLTKLHTVKITKQEKITNGMFTRSKLVLVQVNLKSKQAIESWCMETMLSVQKDELKKQTMETTKDVKAIESEP